MRHRDPLDDGSKGEDGTSSYEAKGAYGIQAKRPASHTGFCPVGNGDPLGCSKGVTRLHLHFILGEK